MAVPTYDKFIEPVLRVLAAHPEGMPVRDAHEAAADRLGLDGDDRALAVPTGQPLYNNRAGWAHDRLKRVGYSSSPKRGTWQLTDAGRSYVAAHPTPLSPEEVREIAKSNLNVHLGLDNQAGITGIAPTASEPDDVQSPDDRLQTALDEIRESVGGDLLELLAGISPKYFETVVLDVLHKLGYGTNRSDLQRVGGTGDAGIDGVISLDRLGLEKVYVQAKRWQSTVGRPEIQAFYGALAGQHANKGIFITTSAFSQQAVDFAKSVERIVLVDGQTLAGLMMDNEVGVNAQHLSLPKIDSDYFEE